MNDLLTVVGLITFLLTPPITVEIYMLCRSKKRRRRLVFTNHGMFPYIYQRRGLFKWYTVTEHNSEEDANKHIEAEIQHEQERQRLRPEPKIIKEFEI